MKMNMRMMFEKKFLLTLVAIAMLASLAVIPFATSRRTFYSFEIIVPEEVEAMPGQNVTVDGGVLVTGFYWLHNFELKVSGLPYDYKIEPEWWEHVRILREWNPEQGVYRVPEKFKLDINVPEDATGSYIVTITGQEHHSFREISNFSYFVLRVGGKPIKPQLTISDIIIPENITEYEPFRLIFKVDNEGVIDTIANISIKVPEDWEVDEPTQTIKIRKNKSVASAFNIIPTTTPGEVSLYVEYPFRDEVINFTKTGPYLIPAGVTTTTKPEEFKPIFSQIVDYLNSLLEAVTDSIESVAGPYATSLIVGVIFVLFIIILWLIFDIIKFVKKGSESKKSTEQIDSSTSTSNSNDYGVRLTEV